MSATRFAILAAVVLTLAGVSYYTRVSPLVLPHPENFPLNEEAVQLSFGALTDIQKFNAIKAATLEERYSLKGDEIIAKLNPGVFQDPEHGFTITIESIQKTDTGVSLYASATRNGQKIGFLDGTVEIEHFIFINPPLLIDDPAGPITIETLDLKGQPVQRKLKFDARQALLTSLADTMSMVQKGSDRVIPGKRGDTTTTAFTSKDEFFRRGNDVNQTWANIRSGAGTSNSDSNCGPNILGDTTSNQYDVLERCGLLFDTSAIPDSETIDSATISFYGRTQLTGISGMSVNVVSFSPASDVTFATSDYGNFGSTNYSTDFAVSSWAVESYNDMALNASGLAAISKTGTSRFGLRFKEDIDGTSPTWVSGAQTIAQFYDSANAGTTKDAKLVVVSSTAAAASSGEQYTIIFN